MDLKALKTFHAIVKHGSFIRAAEELNYVQSTVTMQIQKLESEVGAQLFDRGREIRLTEAGRLLYEESLHIIKKLEQLQMHLSDLKSGESGHIRIGVTEPTASFRLPGILKTFMALYPNIRISVEVSNTPGLIKRVLSEELDFALATAPSIGSELYYEPLFEEEFVVLLPQDHPLCDQDAIVPEDLNGYRLLVTSATCPYRRKLEMVLQERGHVAWDTMEIGSMTALKYYVKAGLGIALVPRIIVDAEGEGLVARSIEGSLVHMTFGILCKDSNYPFQYASQKLYMFLKQALASAGAKAG